MYLPIPNEAVEALSEGKSVKITHADLGAPGHNGTITLDPEEYSDPVALEPDVEIQS